MIEARFRHRASYNDRISVRHTSVISCLANESWLWDQNPLEVSVKSAGESSACDLTPFLKAGLRGAISYSARNPSGMMDKAIFDDVLTLQINEKDVDYTEFATEVFGRIASCFRSYRAAVVQDLGLDLDDFERIVEVSRDKGIDADGRDGIFRIHPLNYFDEEICKRAFHHNIESVIELLEGHVELVDCRDAGVLIRITSGLLDRDDLIAGHNRVAKLLRLDR